MSENRKKLMRRCGAVSAVLAALLFNLLPGVLCPGPDACCSCELRISDWETGMLYARHPVSPGDEISFGWIHSLEKIPWNEYYHVDDELNLVLDTVSFTAFGAGIPHDIGNYCHIKDGVIYMSEINQKFTELIWMNSPDSVQEIRVAGEFVTCGSDLPHHRRLILAVYWRVPYER